MQGVYGLIRPGNDRCAYAKGRCSREHRPSGNSSACRACVRSVDQARYMPRRVIGSLSILLFVECSQLRQGLEGFRPVLHEVSVLDDALVCILLLDRVCSVWVTLWFLGGLVAGSASRVGGAIPSTTRGHPEPRCVPRPVRAETRECRREMSRRGPALGRWCAPT